MKATNLKIGRYIDLALPDDKTPMFLSDYNSGHRWDWKRTRCHRMLNDDKMEKQRYKFSGKQAQRKASEFLVKYSQKAEQMDASTSTTKISSRFPNFPKPGLNKSKKPGVIGDKTVVLGTKEKIYATGDVGLLGAVLEAYNHHWNLKISPDDFWIPVAIRVGKKINENAKNDKVREFFVDFEAKKEIVIEIGKTLIHEVDYVWLFDEFSQQIKNLIKKPEYNDLMTANFSTSTPITRIASQINIMSSLQEYFDYGMKTLCGIKGVEMLGNLEDWKSLITKIDQLAELLKPLEKVLRLSYWFELVREVYEKLLATFEGKPDINWWSRIISKDNHGSGACKYMGWIFQFLEGNLTLFEILN